MKKVISLVIILGIFSFVFQVGINFLKKKHDIKYSIEENNIVFDIHEIYTKKDDTYKLKISMNNNDFLLKFENKYNKQKEIVEEISYYEDLTKNLLCISPRLIGEKQSSTIICNISGTNLTYSAMIMQYDIDFTKVFDNIDLSKYINDISTYDNYFNSKIYSNNFEEESLILYYYRNIARVKKNEISGVAFALSDVYENKLGVLAGKYYVIPRYTMSPGYTKIYTFDISENKIRTVGIELENGIISSNTYLNGVVNGKVYMVDRSNKIQYEINPNNDKIRVIGNETIGAQYYHNGDWSTISIYDFINSEIYFSDNITIPEQFQNKYIEFFETQDAYYYYNEDYEFYRIYKDDLNIQTLLFKTNDIKEVIIKGKNIYFISENELLRYNDKGLKTLVYNSEYEHNYQNIYSVY